MYIPDSYSNYGNSHVFDTLLGSVIPSDDTMNFLRDKLNKNIDYCKSIGFDFYNETKDKFESYFSNSSIDKARRIVNKISNRSNVDYICYLPDIDSIQNTGLVMQRWVMANPEVRKLYHRQLCDGYSSTYEDVFPNDIKEDHYDYRRVTDGVMMENKEGNYTTKWYIEDLLPSDRHLTSNEKIDIINTWNIINNSLLLKELDPTSNNGCML